MTVTIATIVRNEAANFLRPALECWSALADRIVAVDNGSTDETPDILSEFGAEVHEFDVPMDGNEVNARRFLWEKAVDGSEWVVWADADHCFAGDFRPHLRGRRVVFPVFDMWSATEYRSDSWWQVRPWWQAVNVADQGVVKEFIAQDQWEWPERGWHSGHVPLNTSIFGPALPIPRECGLLHYGYASPELRSRHFDAYTARRAHLTPSEIMHARTILDPDPHTLKLPFTPAWTLL